MSDITVLERRLAAAIARMARATDALQPSVAVSDAVPTPVVREVTVEVVPDQIQNELDQLRTDLVAAQTQVSAQDTFIQDQSEQLAKLSLAEGAKSDRAAKAEDMIAALETNLDQLRQSNDQLRTANAELRAANAEGLGDASLINAALQVSHDSLVAERDLETTQLGQVIQLLNADEQEPQNA